MEMNIPFVPSVNFRKGRTQPHNRGGKATPCTLIVVHYTAGGDFDATADYLAKKNPASASAHFVVARGPDDGQKHPGVVVQLVDLDDVAFHAGESSWDGQRGVNAFSVGIEICNWGPLNQDGNIFTTWSGAVYTAHLAEPVFCVGRWWEPFTDFQYEVVAGICAKIIAQFPEITPERIIGHCDVAPGRKLDPGPAWDWDRFRELLSKEVGHE